MNESKHKARLTDPWICSAVAFIATLGIFLCGAVSPVAARTNKVDLTENVKEVPPRPALYDTKVAPLTMEQCAQCHTGVFNLLAEKGKRHQLPCTFCHTKYHTFAPGKVEYADAVPKCTHCHGTPHGTDGAVATCSKCHSNAHSPLTLPDVTPDMCSRCHQGPPEQLKTNISKHSEVACTDCHTSHGFIPKCVDCHSEEGGLPYHLTGVEQSTCLVCHPVHHPLDLNYPKDTPQKHCAPCHKNPSHARVLKEIQEANSKHNTKVTCATCHEKHGQIPSCFKCHKGHLPEQTVEDCLACHKNPHQPKNIHFTGTEPQKFCSPCHPEEYKKLLASKTRHTAQPCSKCHNKHGRIPDCSECHGKPHGDKIHNRFAKCADCHGSAHNVQGRIKEKKK